MGEYSPAPWQIIYAGLDDMTEAQRIEEEMPVVAIGPVNYTEFSEAGSKRERANARLISASPIMYSYLEKKAAEGDEEAQRILGAI